MMRRAPGLRAGKTGCLTWLVASVLVVAVLALINAPRRRPNAVAPGAPSPAPAARPWAKLRVCDVARLSLPGASGVWICLDETAWEAMIDAENAGARGVPGAGAGIYQLAHANRIKFYPVGLKVRLIKMGAVSRQVEIIEGDDAGDRGWIQMEFLSP